MTDTTMTEQQYLVEGMTCGHCVASVTEEISELVGVTSVSVDLNVGGASRVTVVSAAPLSFESMRTAVTEAGYMLVAA
jgi:copper chaperone